MPTLFVADPLEDALLIEANPVMMHGELQKICSVVVKPEILKMSAANTMLRKPREGAGTRPLLRGRLSEEREAKRHKTETAETGRCT